MPLIDRTDFLRAVQNVAAWGDTDVFPFPVENHVLYDQGTDVVDLLERVATDFDSYLTTRPPVNYSALAPVGYNGFRWATQLDPLWNVYLLGLILSLAPKIEEARIPRSEETVFSYRYEPAQDGSLFVKTGWKDFQQRSSALASSCKYVVVVDIADFYSRIYHHRVENELKYIDIDGSIARQITRLLGQFSKGVSYGLPVGGPAARVLAELLLNSTDHLLKARSDVTFTRYADDYRFFVDDIESAYRCIGNLSETLHQNEGLSLQRAKTRIFTSSEFLAATQPESPRPGSAAKFLSLHLHYDPYSATAQDDYEKLKEQLEEFDVVGLLRAELFKGRVDAALTRRLVGVMQYLAPTPRVQAIKSLIENVDVLAPVMPQVMRAIRDSLENLEVDTQQSVQKSLRELVESGKHVTQVNVNLAFLVRALAKTPSRENEQLLARLYNGSHGYGVGPAPNIQRDIVLTLARWRANYWLHDLKPHYATMHEWVQRAFFIGSYSLGDEGRHWRSSVRSRQSEFDGIVATWAAAKSQQPGWQIPL